MAHPHLIVLQGAPGTGKTTLAARLSRDTGVDYFSKDAFKEQLYDTVGHPQTVETTKLYGRIAIRAMYVAADEYVRAGRDVMIEAPLEAKFAIDDLAAIVDHNHVLQLHIACDPEEQVNRFRARIHSSERHEGHLDTTDFSIDDARESQERNGRLPGFETITVDTTDFTDDEYQELLRKVKEKLS